MDQITWDFVWKDLLWVYYEFCSSQGHMAIKKAKTVWRPEWVWLLQSPYDLGFDKIQNKPIKDPYMQNFMSFGQWGADLQHPSWRSLHTLLSPFFDLRHSDGCKYKMILVILQIRTNMKNQFYLVKLLCTSWFSTRSTSNSKLQLTNTTKNISFLEVFESA